MFTPVADWRMRAPDGAPQRTPAEALGGKLNDVALPFESFGVSHKGCVREHNEDNYLVEPQTGLWVVADGMGGT